MSDETLGGEALVSRIAMIEQQPLGDRAAGFAKLHDELLSELERSDRGSAA